MQGFLSYSHEDHALYRGFHPHLRAIRRAFDMPIWVDDGLHVGMHWAAKIEAEIKAADVFMLLITPDFIASDYVYEKEIPAIQERRRTAGALVLPVVLKRCTWQMVASALQATPTDNGRVKPITDWHRANDGFDRAREQIMASIENHFGINRKNLDWGST
jgi:hypothetical protein